MNKPAAHSHPPRIRILLRELESGGSTHTAYTERVSFFRAASIRVRGSLSQRPAERAAPCRHGAQRLGGRLPTWIGFFSGGATGNEFARGTSPSGDRNDGGIHGPIFARVNLEILDTQGEVTEILEPGGTITQSEWSEFQQVCAGPHFNWWPAKKVAVISGSLPPGVPTEACAAPRQLGPICELSGICRFQWLATVQSGGRRNRTW